MAKIKVIKSKKRVLKIKRLISVFFIFSFFGFILTSLFLKSYNYSLSADIENINSRITELEQQNASIELRINSLLNHESVLSVASQDGMARNNNVTQIIGD